MRCPYFELSIVLTDSNDLQRHMSFANFRYFVNEVLTVRRGQIFWEARVASRIVRFDKDHKLRPRISRSHASIPVRNSFLVPVSGDDGLLAQRIWFLHALRRWSYSTKSPTFSGALQWGSRLSVFQSAQRPARVIYRAHRGICRTRFFSNKSFPSTRLLEKSNYHPQLVYLPTMAIWNV